MKSMAFFNSLQRLSDQGLRLFSLQKTVCFLSLGSLCLLLALGLRPWLESSMWRHMVLQFPLLLVAGAALALVLPPQARRWLDGWNRHGIAGLVLCATVLAVLMVPRILDLALLHPEVEAAKCSALLLAGAGLALSWRPAGAVLQFFFLGNLLGMTAIVGLLYIDSPLRLCNAYLQDDQIRLGQWLVGISSALAVAWLARVAWDMTRHEARALGQAR